MSAPIHKLHPEQGPREHFVGNTSDGIREDLKVLQSIRLGSVAFDIDGKRLPSIYRPMFVGAGDATGYDQIMMDGLAKIGKGARS